MLGTLKAMLGKLRKPRYDREGEEIPFTKEHIVLLYYK